MRKEIIEIEVKGTGDAVNDINKVSSSLDGLQSNMKDVKKESEGAKKGIDDVASNGGAIAILDRLTGGLATSFKDTYEATKLFNVSLKATKTALIATGIGALVVALGLIVAYWDDIVELIGGANKKLQKQIDLNKENIGILDFELKLLEAKEKILLAEGKSTEEIKKQKEKILGLLLLENDALLDNLQAQLLTEQSQASQLTFAEKALNVLRLAQGQQKQFFSNITEEEKTRIDEITKAIQDGKLKAEQLKLSLIEINKPLEAKIEPTTIEKGKERKKVIPIGTQLANDQEIINNADQIKELKDRETQDRLAAYREQIRQEDLLAQQTQAEQEEILRQQKVQGAINVLDALTGLASAESDIGKALLLAKQVIAARELVLSIKSTIMAAKESTTKSVLKASEAGVDIAAGAGKTAAAAPFPVNIPLILGYAATAIGIIGSVKSALSKQKSVASQFGGGGGGGIESFKTPQAQSPSFNVVGQSGTNQLAESIGGQSKEPIKAYVVSKDMSSQQELDRNTQKTATFG
jgi:hypothetical protein